MTTTTTSRRRRLSAAAIGLALLLVPGCAELSEPADSEPAASTSGAPAETEDATAHADARAAETEDATAGRPSAAPSASSGTGADDPRDGADGASEGGSVGGADVAEEQASDASDDADDGSGADAKAKAKDESKDKAKDKADAKDEGPDWPAYGASGKQVTALQQRLVDLGYFLPEVDGQFGPATQQAVWALQKAAGLGRDGVVGPKTRKALKRGVRPDATSSTGKVVEIDLARQLLMTVEDGRVTRVLNASSGNGETYEAKGRTYRASTPRGSFAVYMERNYLHESTLELGSMYRPKYFHGSFAVHGSGSIPPWPASHGCVRVSNSAMNWLWDTWGMSKGTPVVVY